MKINNLNKILYFILGLSLFIELYLDIDSAGSGGLKVILKLPGLWLNSHFRLLQIMK